MSEGFDPKPARHVCLNNACGETLFISHCPEPESNLRVMDREDKGGRDERGDFIECSKCGTKHDVALGPPVPGQGIPSRIIGVRK